jgi:type III pantothenate kinase
MLLAVDIGNTNLTLGSIRDGRVVSTRRATSDPQLTSDELEVTIEALLGLDGGSLESVDTLTLASVVPALTAALETIAEHHELPLVIASAGTVPIPVRVDRPGEVGADRLVNALAAIRLHGAPAIVVDVGTATTIDCVAADGAFIGGAIAPGLVLGLEALAARTAKLPRVELRTPERAIGRDTVTAIQAGAVLGYQSLVSGLVTRVRRELTDAAGGAPSSVPVVLTGGLARAPWAAGIEGIDVVDPELTIKGLAILHAEVAGGERPAAERP